MCVYLPRGKFTITEEFNTASCESAIGSANDRLDLVAPVFGRFVEVGHSVDTNLVKREGKSGHQHSLLHLSETATYWELSLLGMSITERSFREWISVIRPCASQRRLHTFEKS